MGKKFIVSYGERIDAIEKYLRKEDSLNHLALKLGVNGSAITQWLCTYQSLGPDGLRETSKNTSYSSVLKESAVLDYLSGHGSYMDLCKKYGIKSTRQLRNWVLKYNGLKELKASGTGGTLIMTKGRKTTYEERVEIVKYCFEHQKNYTEASEKYQVSYQQVYTWISKYEKIGIEALMDKRGKRKLEGEMSDVEKLKVQNKLLEAENKSKQMEIDFLKKLHEVERRRY